MIYLILNSSTYSVFFRKVGPSIMIGCLFFISAPSLVEASIFSSITSMFSSVPEKPKQVDTIQTMQILEASETFAPRVKGFVVDENSLATLPEEDSVTNVPLISTYTVHSGDTLSSIANMFNVSVNTILWSNNLTKKDTIKPGQSLVILPVSGVSHTIKKGDTISGIAKKYNADIDEIMSFNGISDNSDLVVGDSVIVPDGELAVITTSKQTIKPTTKLLTKGGIAGLVTGGYDRDPQGYFIRPVVGGVRTQGLHGFNGVDLANKTGSPIYAAAGGTVIISKSGGWNGGYGSYVVVSHPNGMQTLYAHLSVVIVGVGERVQQGDLVGKMGMTGKATGPHLHFEVRGGKNPF